MSIKYNSSAEAYIGVGMVLLAADGEYSSKEAVRVFDSMQSAASSRD